MKILKFSGIVVGIHLVALILIFANPGCSSSTKPTPAPADTAAKSDSPPTITASAPMPSSNDVSAAPASTSIAFNPDNGIRYSPTRPGTPAASTLQVEPVGNVTPAVPYTVVGGDSLSLIAKKNHTTVQDLAAANNLNPNTAKLHPGQKLIIPGKLPAPPKQYDPAVKTSAAAAPTDSSAPKTAAEGIPYTVKPGENLSTIAKKYGVKQGDIAVANNISDPQKIRAGMVLTIPGWKSTDGKPVRSPKAGAADASARNDSETKAPATVGSEPMSDPATRQPAGDVPVIQVEEAPAPAK